MLATIHLCLDVFFFFSNFCPEGLTYFKTFELKNHQGFKAEQHPGQCRFFKHMNKTSHARSIPQQQCYTGPRRPELSILAVDQQAQRPVGDGLASRCLWIVCISGSLGPQYIGGTQPDTCHYKFDLGAPPFRIAASLNMYNFPCRSSTSFKSASQSRHV